MERIINIENHVYEEQQRFSEATGEFSGLLCELALAGKIVSREVNKAGLVDILGKTGGRNVQGEQVRKMDILARDTFVGILEKGGHVSAIVTEEDVDIIHITQAMPRGDYVVSMDPLDGSSNIDANISVGTIFGVHHLKDEDTIQNECELCRPGSELVCAGYIVYGSSTMMVYTTSGGAVHGFTLDPSLGEFLLSHPDMRIPEKGRIFSINEGYSSWWKDHTRRYISYLKSEGDDRPYSSRYVGSLVADFHRNLLYGGIYLYPENSRDHEQSGGKIRLLYEAAPLAFVVEAAGGRATTGTERILDIVPDQIHQRVPLILGSRLDVEEYEAFCRENALSS